MKIFFDENIDPAFKSLFEGDIVETVKSKNWLGKKNGELLGLVVFNGFDVFITKDRNLKYQQNLNKLGITIVVLISKSNDEKDLTALLLKAKKLLKSKSTKRIIEIS